mmetsp:Transcript_52407/g.152524  ORF Transcript_52407/g.152524 Transcript_52407/m.152524 type:complete len:230 (+) Transcript_52407:373-1062(+)
MVAAPDPRHWRKTSVWNLKTGMDTAMELNRPAIFGAFSPGGDKLVVLVLRSSDLADGCFLQVLSTASGEVRCGAPSPLGQPVFHRDRIVVQGTYFWSTFVLRSDSSGRGGCKLVRESQEVLHHIAWNSVDIHGRFAADGKSALIFSTGPAGGLGVYIWLFAEGKAPRELSDWSPRSAFSADGAVYAHVANDRTWMNFSHTHGGGSVRFSAEGPKKFRNVAVGRARILGS